MFPQYTDSGWFWSTFIPFNSSNGHRLMHVTAQEWSVCQIWRDHVISDNYLSSPSAAHWNCTCCHLRKILYIILYKKYCIFVYNHEYLFIYLGWYFYFIPSCCLFLSWESLLWGMHTHRQCCTRPSHASCSEPQLAATLHTRLPAESCKIQEEKQNPPWISASRQ